MTARRWLLGLLLLNVAVRVGLGIAYEPVSHPDTGTYFTVARSLVSGDFSEYEGRRTPGYPALIAAAGLSPRGVFLLQMLGGVAVSCLLFDIGLQLTGRPAFAALLGATYTLNLAQLFFEANLLSESLSTLSVVATSALLVRACGRLRDSRAPAALLLGLGAVAGAAVLVRPQFVFLPLLAGAAIGYVSVAVSRSSLGVALWRAVLTTGPGVLMILGWCWFNYLHLGFFTLSSQTGITMMNQSLPFVKRAPDRWATIRDIYVRYRDEKVAATGRHNANWDAIPELQAKTGLAFPALSKELERMSIALFVRNPVQYTVGVARSAIDFWLAPNYWRLDRLHPNWLAGPMRGLWRLEHPLVRATNAVFLVTVAGAVVSGTWRARLGWGPELAALAAVALGACTVAALIEWGENARYGIPVQALVIAIVLISAERVRARSRVNSGVARPSSVGGVA